MSNSAIVYDGVKPTDAMVHVGQFSVAMVEEPCHSKSDSAEMLCCASIVARPVHA